MLGENISADGHSVLLPRLSRTENASKTHLRASKISKFSGGGSPQTHLDVPPSALEPPFLKSWIRHWLVKSLAQKRFWGATPTECRLMLIETQIESPSLSAHHLSLTRHWLLLAHLIDIKCYVMLCIHGYVDNYIHNHDMSRGWIPISASLSINL